jgi:hypothetical protein
MMKKLFFVLSVLTSVIAVSCSQCYECSSTSYITDGSGNVVDTTSTTNDICTANADEITDREADGEVCRVK